MIPKIIHYIWFGHSAYPEKVQSCINSWKYLLPDYQFMLWNEKSFDVYSITFTKEAYERKKWAFVSDYVRLYALYTYGGWYLDTDIEVVKSFSDLLEHRVVLGTDDKGCLDAVIGAEKRHPYIESVLRKYENMSFVLPDHSLNMEVINSNLQKELKKYGYVIKNSHQQLPEGITVYPDDYFSVVSLVNGKEHRTSNTYAIHWHTLLWISRKQRVIRFLRIHILAPLLGTNNYIRLTKLVKSLWNKK